MPPKYREFLTESRLRALAYGFMVWPLIFSLFSWVLLRALHLSPRPEVTTPVSAAFVGQWMLAGWVFARLDLRIEHRVLLYAWTLLLVDLQLFVVLVESRNWWRIESGIAPVALICGQICFVAAVTALLGSNLLVRVALGVLAVAVALHLWLFARAGDRDSLMPVVLVQALAVLAVSCLLRGGGYEWWYPTPGEERGRRAQFELRHVLLATTLLGGLFATMKGGLIGPGLLEWLIPRDPIWLATGILSAAAMLAALWAGLSGRRGRRLALVMASGVLLGGMLWGVSSLSVKLGVFLGGGGTWWSAYSISEAGCWWIAWMCLGPAALWSLLQFPVFLGCELRRTGRRSE